MTASSRQSIIPITTKDSESDCLFLFFKFSIMTNKIKVIQQCIEHLVQSKDEVFSSYSTIRGYEKAIEELRTYLIDEQEREKQEYEDTESEYTHDKFYAEPVGDYKYHF